MSKTKENIKASSKDEMEWAVLASDRIGLVDAAVSILEAIQGRHALTGLSSVPQDVVLTGSEQDAYNAALGFLAREFNKGAEKAQSHMTKASTDHTNEFHVLEAKAAQTAEN